MNPKTRLFLLSVITALFLLLYFNRCEKPVYIIPNLSNLKAEISVLKHSKDSASKVIEVKEIERIRVVNKWKLVRHNSLIPCDTLIAYCDTMYLVDSSLIASQKVLIGIQDSVIRMQDIVIKSDSVTISDLSREVKKQKRLKWLFLGIGLVPNMIR